MPAAKPEPGTLKTEIELGELLGSRWDGFLLLPGDSDTDYQGLIQHPYWRKPFEIGELCAMFWKSQHVYMLQHDKERLQREAEQAHARADEAEHRMQFYRRELRAASRLGMMFSALERDDGDPKQATTLLD